MLSALLCDEGGECLTVHVFSSGFRATNYNGSSLSKACLIEHLLLTQRTAAALESYLENNMQVEKLLCHKKTDLM
jgi:hypothetical protein